MENVKLLNSILNPKNTLTLGVSTSFRKILEKLNKSKHFEAVLVKKPNASQMAAVILARLSGKKFIWIQSFSNPPVPSFVTRLMLNQADIIIVSSAKNIKRLKNLGVDKPKIKINKVA